MATRFIMLQGLAEFAKSKGKLDDLEDRLDNRAMKLLYPNFTSEFHRRFTNREFLRLDSLIPGDRVWMKNHKFSETFDPEGNEGSNVIYVGKSKEGEHLFLHMEGAYIETFEQLRVTVSKYSKAKRRDPKIENYRFEERYAPLLPKCIDWNKQ